MLHTVLYLLKQVNMRQMVLYFGFNVIFLTYPCSPAILFLTSSTYLCTSDNSNLMKPNNECMLITRKDAEFVLYDVRDKFFFSCTVIFVCSNFICPSMALTTLKLCFCCDAECHRKMLKSTGTITEKTYYITPPQCTKLGKKKYCTVLILAETCLTYGALNHANK